jgi:peptide/nickel transport system permease protein
MRIPISALVGMFFTGAFFLAAIFAPLIAPYGMAEIVGGVWDPASGAHLLGRRRSLWPRPQRC